MSDRSVFLFGRDFGEPASAARIESEGMPFPIMLDIDDAAAMLQTA
jgi:hypothetical protein